MRILMHAPANLLEAHGHHEAVRDNLINNNFGELLFPYSVSRALMSDSTQIDYCNLARKTTLNPPPGVINERYDHLVLPLANHLRPSYASRLEALTEYLEQITIPITIPCIGWQGGLRQEPESGLPRDDINKKFCKVILERSPAIGVRGESTGRYLEHLGFKPEEDFMVLGCPSMYMFGSSLPTPKPLNLTKSSQININNKISLPLKIHKFMRSIANDYPNSYYIPQNLYELKLVYSGIPLTYTYDKKIRHPEYFPLDLSDDLYTEDRVRGFVDVPSWFEFLRQGELNIGTRIHGNLSGVLNGNPTFIIACDARVHELASYHNVPHITLDKLPDDASLETLVGSVDFNQIQQGHEERFERYLGFLHESGFQTVFDNGTPEATPFDKAIDEMQFPGPIVTPTAAPLETFGQRMAIWPDNMKLYRMRKAKNPDVGRIYWKRSGEADSSNAAGPKRPSKSPFQKLRRKIGRLVS